MKPRFGLLLLSSLLGSGYLLASASASVVGPGETDVGVERTAPADSQRVFEIRTYTTHEGRLDALHRRFRNHTMRLFEKHGMTNIGYWVPQDTALARNTLIYILAHPSREAARESWRAFGADPEWQRARAESEADGAILQRIESVFVDATDYSPLR